MKRTLPLFFLLVTCSVVIAQNVTIQKILPGTLGKEILRQVDNLSDVESLIVLSGTLGDNDFELLQNTMPNLKHLDLGGISNTTLATTLGPKPLLESLILPQHLTYLPPLGNIPSIKELDIPASVVRIGKEVLGNQESFTGFNGYFHKQLRQLILHEGLKVIDDGAFNNCDSLRQIVLPSTLIKATNAFPGCDSLKDVTCLAPVPPLLANIERYSQWNYDKQAYEITKRYEDGEGLFRCYRGDETTDRKMYGRVLTIPSTGNYVLERGWDHFQSFRNYDGEPAKNYRVAFNYSLIGDDIPTNKPNLTLAHGFLKNPDIPTQNDLVYAGKMLLRSSQTLSLGTYIHETDQDETALLSTSTSGNFLATRDDVWPSLYTDGPMRADSVKVSMRFTQWSTSHGYWAFTSLPFDAKISDMHITGGKSVQWAIRKYAGQKRANAQFDEVWVKQTNDSTLHAGEGFIISVTFDWEKCDGATLVFTAQNNATKNRIFTNQDVQIPLQQYAAQADCDRSWNLVGNPYPCFYSTKYFLPGVPFTVYDKKTQRYRTYSPIDDDYVLNPFESFFIQRPLGYEKLDMPQYGRFQSIEEYEAFMKELDASSSNSRRRAPSHNLHPDRKVFNLQLLRKNELIDRTRLVINPDATANYEIGVDATKFQEIDNNHTILYIIGSDATHYAISEQCLNEGEQVKLGAYFAEEGEYSIIADSSLVLTDFKTGITTLLNQPYHFTAPTGVCDNRFVIARAASRAAGYQNGNVTADDVQYRLDYNGQAYITSIDAQKETVEIPAFVTYNGMRYRVSSFSMSALRDGNSGARNTAVRHLILPSTITQINDSYISDDDALESITLYALFPPENYFKIYDNYEKYHTFKLYVPRAVVDDYKTTKGWWELQNILPAETDADIIAVEQGYITYDDSNRPTNTPQLLLYDDAYHHHGGHIEVKGSQTLALKNFESNITISSIVNATDLRNANDDFCSSLINTTAITAQNLAVNLTGQHGMRSDWYYLCLPYALRPNDMTATLPFVTSLLRYDSQSRAAGNAQSTNSYNASGNWKEVGANDIIPAGEGFILSYITTTPQYSNYYDFQLKLPAQTVTNDMFAQQRTITLKDYPATNVEDRGWNLVGNTFPAYYQMSASDIKVPYMVYGKDTEFETSDYYTKHYYTYTRDDDDMLLKPFQAFFVQYNDVQPTINMPASGRYHSYPQFLASQPSGSQALRRAAEENRQLFDIHVIGDGQHDRTRIVLNERAQIAFEPTCDAPKLMSQGMSMLYTLEDDKLLSINERPTPAEGITLCLDVAIEGDYTLSLGKHTGTGILLKDLATGTTTPLDEAAYNFHSATGTRHFLVSFANSTTAIPSVSTPTKRLPIYNLQGQKVDGVLKPGIYIKDGKKIIMK